MTIDLFIPIVRQLLQILGGVLIAKGYLAESSLEPLIGLGVNVLVLGWWLFDRSRINRKNLINKYVAERQ